MSRSFLIFLLPLTILHASQNLPYAQEDLSSERYVNTTLPSGMSWLFMYTKENDLEMVNLCINNKANVNFVHPNTRNTPLHVAVTNNNLNIVKALLAAPNINVNIRNNSGDTPLHIAVTNSNLDIVKALLATPNINVNIRNNSGNTPLDIALTNSNLDIVSALLEFVELPLATAPAA